MAVKHQKPTTPGRRQMIIADFSHLTKKKPEKALLSKRKQNAGRGHGGQITVRHRGGGAKRKLRTIDWKQDKMNVSGRVAALEYDPGRTAYIMLVNYKDGDKRYLLAPEGIKVGDEVVSSPKAPIKTGNRAKLGHIPTGIPIFNIELSIGKGGQIIRSAGGKALIMAKEGDWVTVKLPSSEIRKIHKNCFATIGSVSNTEHNLISIGKAGRNRWKGIRPTVRGSVMNPVDHPHGGGEGKAPVGIKKGPKTPWGKKALGVKTRRKKKYSNQFIVNRRSKNK
ncbi:MAG TPA: 50S ribosomal protein L2 [Patescibacteria group bacterium]|nr:50S ribosomal protein L2 [Patescibacteria group bacterium]